MAIRVHVLCRSDAPITYGELEDYMGHWGWLDRPARFEPPPDGNNRTDTNWESFEIYYAEDKRPLHVRRYVGEQVASILRDIRDLFGDVEIPTQMSARLEQTKMIVAFEVPGELPDDVWDMLDATEMHLARERDGIVVSEEGVYDAELRPLLRLG